VSDWDRIVREHGPLVYATAKRILGHTADAEDVFQDVFLEAHHYAQARPVRHWPALLRRVATCRALDSLRRRRNVLPLPGVNVRAGGQGPEEAAIAKELADRLRQGLASLAPREGEVFCLRYFDDLSYQQIAEVLEIPAGAVAQALHKARARLEPMLSAAVKGA
jgi:RNA polymerase sigma-70 factor (ECF subfamily)